MEFGRVDVSSLVGIESGATNLDLVESIVNLGGAVRPVVVVREGWKEDFSDYNYRVVANHDVAKAAKGAREIDPRAHEMVNCMIVDADKVDEALKMF